MKPLPHSYEVALSGGPTGYATLSTDGVPPLRFGATKGFDGPGDAWSPEHLLLAAACANRVLEKGKTACLVTASLSLLVRLEAEILAEA